MIRLLHFRSLPHARPQFEGRLEIVPIEGHYLQQLRQRLARHDPGKLLMSNHAANHRKRNASRLLTDPNGEVGDARAECSDDYDAVWSRL